MFTMQGTVKNDGKRILVVVFYLGFIRRLENDVDHAFIVIFYFSFIWKLEDEN
jgi:hypothetical protein